MKCLFVYFSYGKSTFFSHAIALLSAIARKENFEVDLTVIKNNDKKANTDAIISKSPDIIAFSLPTLYWHDGNELALEIKKLSPATLLWAGGSHINALPDSFFNSPFDSACYGDGEKVFKAALKALREKVSFKHASWLTKTNVNLKYNADIINDFDSAPLPDLSLFPKSVILEYPSLYFSKGCPFSCNYCMSRNGGYAKKVRWKSPERAIEECIQIIHYCNPSELYFDDDTFLKNTDWVISFLKMYILKVKLPFYCNSRPELLNNKICEFLSDNLCQGIGIGIESGNERIRKDILGRNITDKEIIDAFRICKKNNLETWSFNMVNIPTENIRELEDTIRLNGIISPTYVRVSIFTPFPGSPLYEERDNYFSYFSSDYEKVISSPKKREIISHWIEDLTKQNRLWNDQ